MQKVRFLLSSSLLLVESVVNRAFRLKYFGSLFVEGDYTARDVCKICLLGGLKVEG